MCVYVCVVCVRDKNVFRDPCECECSTCVCMCMCVCACVHVCCVCVVSAVCAGERV